MATNPWTKKNPWLSLWLSGANTVLSHARGQAMAEAQRQANAMMNQSFEQMMRWWGGPWTAGSNELLEPPPRRHKRAPAKKRSASKTGRGSRSR